MWFLAGHSQDRECPTPDLIAYETFRMMHVVHKTGVMEARKGLKTMFYENGFLCYYYDRDTLMRMKGALESSMSVPNGFIVNFRPVADEDLGDEDSEGRD